jgi:hypothetical protein
MNVIDVDVENAQATQDVLRELQIECYGREETAWAKTVIITYEGVEYEVRLNWDENDGYSTYWEGATLPHARLPEFEYVLDCITEGSEV